MYKIKCIIKAALSALMYRKESFLLHYHGPDLMAAIQEYDNIVRAKCKYTDEEGSWEDARDLLWEIINNKGLSIWD